MAIMIPQTPNPWERIAQQLGQGMMQSAQVGFERQRLNEEMVLRKQLAERQQKQLEMEGLYKTVQMNKILSDMQRQQAFRNAMSRLFAPPPPEQVTQYSEGAVSERTFPQPTDIIGKQGQVVSEGKSELDDTHLWKRILEIGVQFPEEAGHLAAIAKEMKPKEKEWKASQGIGYKTGIGGTLITQPLGVPPKEPKWQFRTEDKGDMYRQGYFNPETKKTEWEEWKPKAPTPSTDISNMQAQKRFGVQIRQQFNNLQPVKDFRDVNVRYMIMQEALKESKKTGNMVAVDQALITIFNKMTDPQSVVRESEYARTPQDLALWNRLKGKMAKFMMGGAGLSQDDREALVKMGSKFYETYKMVYKGYENEYRGYATSGGLDPDDVIVPLEIPSPVVEIPPPAQFETWEEYKRSLK